MPFADQPASRLVPPPRLHWLWVFLLSSLTSNLFAAVWLLVIASWVRRVQGESRAYGWCVVSLISSLMLAALTFRRPDQVSSTTLMVVLLSLITHGVVWLIAVYTLRAELQDGAPGLFLGGVMTFFFSSIYFQYHLWDYPVQDLHLPGEPPEAS